MVKSVACAKKLLKASNILDNRGFTPIMALIKVPRGETLHLAKAMLEAKECDLATTSSDGLNCLHIAARMGSSKILGLAL